MFTRQCILTGRLRWSNIRRRFPLTNDMIEFGEFIWGPKHGAPLSESVGEWGVHSIESDTVHIE